MTIISTTAATATATATATTLEKNKDHVLIFPFMAKGHTIPLLHLSAALALRGLCVTLLTTPANAPFLRHTLPNNPNIHIHILTLPFPHLHPLPLGCESTDHLPSPLLYPTFLGATALLRDSFHHLLHHFSTTSSLPLAVLSDFFLGWTLPICRQFSVPRLVFHGMSLFSMSLSKSLWLHRTHLSAADDSEPFHVPGTPPSLLLTRADVPDSFRYSLDLSNPVTRCLSESLESDINSWGVIVNSFAELEKEDHVTLFESFFNNSARAWMVGPLSLYTATLEADDEWVRWLDGKARGSVAYVSFGTQTHVTEEQLNEVWHGLEMSGWSYVWVVRSEKWELPEEEEEGRKGVVVRGWVEQRAVLEHSATGGFVSHCGWNSVLESVAAKVPILAWPMMAEQQLNAKMVVEELGVGWRLEEREGKVVGRREVCEGVRRLMGDGGEKVRRRVEELGRLARLAVGEGGSSSECLNKLIEELRRSKKNM